jgi:excisionase family DNA binding protein
MRRQSPIDSSELPRDKLFGVSETLLVELLDTGEIPYYKVGQRRCVLGADVLVYEKGAQW